VSKSDTATATATAQAIDSTSRILTLRSEDGTEDMMPCRRKSNASTR
jgi:hypothetical protein